MKEILLLDKKEGETPLQALEKFRASNKKYKDIKMTYAGRLDPMASGLLLVLVGEEIKNKEKYLALDKEYEFEILFGFATDTYDILGKITSQPQRQDLWGKAELAKRIKENLKHFTGNFIQAYPLYSSKTIKQARAEKKVLVSSHTVLVKKLEFLKLRTVSGSILFIDIEKRIKKVTGDFRQEEILKIWRNSLSVKHPMFDRRYIATFKITCSSGTYVRGIANSLGEKINLPALAYSIKRTRIGKWRLKE